MSKNGNSAAFPVLAGYIGVTSAPKNNQATSIAMTAPVVETPSSKATTYEGGLITSTGFGEGDMSLEFLLPSKYQTIEDCPVPQDPRIKLIAHGEKMIASKMFSGSVSESVVQRQLSQLLEAIRRDGLCKKKSTGQAQQDFEKNSWQLAQYNPPFTIPFLRHNEIWVCLNDVSEEEVKAALTPRSS
jgi:hypothetical protein